MKVIQSWEGKRNLTYQESADFLGVSVSMVRRLVRDGELPLIPIRGAHRIPRENLERYERQAAEAHAAENGFSLKIMSEMVSRDLA